MPLSPCTVTRSAGQLVRSSVAGGILTIDLDAIVHNYELFRRGVGRASCAAVVKAGPDPIRATAQRRAAALTAANMAPP